MARLNKKEISTSIDSSIAKSNELSTAQLKEGLSLNQMQLLSYAIYSTQQDGSTTFHKVDFEERFGLDEYRTEHAKRDSQKILSIQFGFENLDEDEFTYINVFHEMTYKKGTFTFQWAPKITPHILNLKEKYVLTDLAVAAHFKSGFSWTLYDFIRGSYGHWFKSFSKDELMKLFGVSDKKSYHRNTGTFKQRVLDPAIDEVNKFTEIDVWYEEIKKGRAIVGFKLIWSTGTTVRQASEKQLDILKSMTSAVLRDQLMYIEIDGADNQREAAEIVRLFQSIKNSHLSEDVGMTAEFSSDLTMRMGQKFNALNRLLEESELDKLSPTDEVEPVPMLNWLQELLDKDTGSKSDYKTQNGQSTIDDFLK